MRPRNARDYSVAWKTPQTLASHVPRGFSGPAGPLSYAPAYPGDYTDALPFVERWRHQRTAAARQRREQAAGDQQAAHAKDDPGDAEEVGKTPR